MGHESLLSKFKFIKHFGIPPIVREHSLHQIFLYCIYSVKTFKGKLSSLKHSDYFSISLCKSYSSQLSWALVANGTLQRAMEILLHKAHITKTLQAASQFLFKNILSTQVPPPSFYRKAPGLFFLIL